MSQFKKNLINLGCGRIYHKDWDNFDINPIDETIYQWDLAQGLPFASSSINVLYSSHFLEHLGRYQAISFLEECNRVLCEKGILRLVVPDLEKIARLYLENLEKAISGDTAAAQRYQWIMLELFDQMVRTQSGGEMLDFWQQEPLPEEGFIRNRMGEECGRFLQAFRSMSSEDQSTQRAMIRDRLIKNEKQIPNAFLKSGEHHRWMYDRYSLSLLLQERGFQEIKICTATESRIPNFLDYHLDTDSNGNMRKPDSLFIEAIKSS